MLQEMPKSVLTKQQSKTYTRDCEYYSDTARMVVKIRHDDECGNGHNTFAITADIYAIRKNGTRGRHLAAGCLHDEIAKTFPVLAPFIKWHLCSTDGPLHYVANSVYHAADRQSWGQKLPKTPDLQAARSSAIWPDAELEDFTEPALLARLPALLNEFRAAVESLGFEY